MKIKLKREHVPRSSRFDEEDVRQHTYTKYDRKNAEQNEIIRPARLLRVEDRFNEITTL